MALQVATALEPVLQFCKALVRESDSIQLQVSPGANFRELRNKMEIAVRQIVNDFPIQVTNASVSQLLRFFLEDGSFTSTAGAGGVNPGTGDEDDEQFQIDLNRAIEESLKTIDSGAKDVVDEYQREMQE